MKRLTSEREYSNWVGPQLERLSPRHRAAFAAAAAERQFGTYVYLARKNPRMKPDVLRMALDRVWAYAAGEAVTLSVLSESLREVDPLIPDLDDADAPPEAILVLNAASAVEYALRSCLTEEPNDAMAAGHCAKDAVHEWVDRELRPGLVAIDSQDVEAVQNTIDQHPHMVRELESVRQVLGFLRQQPMLNSATCLQVRRSWSNGKRSNIDLE